MTRSRIFHSEQHRPTGWTWASLVGGIGLLAAFLTPVVPAVASGPADGCGTDTDTIYPGVYEADFDNTWSSSKNLFGEPQSGTARLTGRIRIEVTKRPAEAGKPATLQAQASYDIYSGAGQSDNTVDGEPETWYYDELPFSQPAPMGPQEWAPGMDIPVTVGDGVWMHGLHTASLKQCLAFRVFGGNEAVSEQTWDVPWGPLAPSVTMVADGHTQADLEQRRAEAKAQVDAVVASATDHLSRRKAVVALDALNDEYAGDPCVLPGDILARLQALLDASARDTETLASAGPFTEPGASGTRWRAEESLLLWVDAISVSQTLTPCLSGDRIEQAVNGVTRGFIRARSIDWALELDHSVVRVGFSGVMPEIAAEVGRMANEAFAALRAMLGKSTDAQFLEAAREATRLDDWSVRLGNATNGVIDWLNAHGAPVSISPGPRGTLIIRVEHLDPGKVAKVTDYKVRARLKKGTWKALEDRRSTGTLIRTKTRLKAGKTYQVQVRAIGRNKHAKKANGPWSPTLNITIPPK